MESTLKTNRAYRRRNSDRSGVKDPENLFRDGWSWERFNKKIDKEMTARGLPPEKTATFIYHQAEQI